MRMGSRGRAVLALAACLPATPAWADAFGGMAALPEAGFSAPTGRIEDQALAAGPITASGCIGSAAPCDGNDPQLVAVSRWNLADISSPRAVPDLTTLPPAALEPEPAAPADVYGPTNQVVSGPAASLPPGVSLNGTGHVPREYAQYRGFFKQAGTITTELAVLAVYMGVQTIPKLTKKTAPFHFKDEGWFGKDTTSIGMDKLTHAFNTYLIADILHARLHKNTNASEGDAVTAGVLAAGLMALNEVSDAIEPDSGYSMQDIAMNLTGATLSVLRNTIPGLKEKIAFKIEIMPNDQIYSHVGKEHYAQQRFMLSLKGAGFEGLQKTPLRFLDLQVGYYATDFLNSDREKGIEPKRHLFFGVGLNLGELFWGNSQSRFGKAAYSVLDHVQLPYTSVRVDTHGEFGHW